ncbi:MAG TPA: hypothetical protein VF516_45110, partial [Kofleriaceae bacterium]
EASLAKLVPIAISLFADLIGLGGIADKIRGIIEKVQTKVDQAIDKLITRVMAMFKGKKGDKPDDKPDDRTPEQKQADLDKAVAEVKALGESNALSGDKLDGELDSIKTKYRLTELKVQKKGKGGELQIHAAVNPEATFELFAIKDDASALREAVGNQLSSLPPKATIAQVKALCAQAAQDHLEPGFKLDWQDMRDSWVLFLERPKHPIPRTAVGEFRQAINYTKVSSHGNQTLYKDEAGNEYVNDSIDQYVPRFLTRNISEQDRKSLKQGIKPTAPKRKLSPKEHVMGYKPSPFISTTKLDGDQIENPHGDMLGGEHGTVRIDLSLISSKVIFDLTTRRGQDTWNLSNPEFTKGAKAGTSRQALEDVVRTQEVLIKGDIPPEAIELL